MTEDWKPEMDLSPEKIHRLIVDYNSNIMNLREFKKWMDESYEASQLYDGLDAISVWEDVIDKFEELFK